MKKLQEKYARVILESCLKMEKDQPLLISYNIERSDFVEILTKIANDLGVTDIYYDSADPYERHDALKNLEIDELKKLPFWNKEKWSEYAKKDAAFLMLASTTPGLMKDIDPEKIKAITKYAYETRKVFNERRNRSELAWCIAAVPTKDWAKELYKGSSNPEEELWNKIFDICSIREDNPVELWDKKVKKLEERAKKLNEYNFKTLKYKSSNGTDFKIDLPENHLWAGGREKLANGKEVLPNFPTEEVFTSPDRLSAEGVVYSSKPLDYQGVIIDEFMIRFENGKAVESHAKVGDKNLTNMINVCENSEYLGEVALVPYDSPISNTNQIFLETLFDENAACHIALGNSFPECIKNGPKMTKEELLEKYNLNNCESHVDFMIGTKDLNVIGITKDGEEVPILEEGNFSKIFD